MLRKRMQKRQEKKNDPEVRNHYGMLAGAFGIVSNLFLFFIKFLIGLFSHSITIIADAFNSLTDSFSSIVTIVGFHLAKKKPDRLHPYGYARYEYISGLIISFFMFVMGLFFLKSSMDKIIAPEELSLSLATYPVLGVAILGKFLQMIVYSDFAKTLDSKTLKANAVDARNDIVSTAVILVSMILMGVFHLNLDAYMGILVSLFLLFSAYQMIKETMTPLLGSIPTQEEVEMIRSYLLSCPEIRGIHDLVVHNYGVGKYFVTVHAEVPSSMNIVEAHDIMDNLEKKMKEKYGIYLTIHTDPLDLDDQKRNQLERKVQTILEIFDSSLQIHDFRVVTSDSHTNLIFDVVVPFEKDYSKKELVGILKKGFQEEPISYYFVLEIDHPFY